jgi:AcrR family transcriptional regulator
MEEIALETELSKTTLYFYFEDKESLFLAVVNSWIKKYRAMAIEEELKQTDGIKDKILDCALTRFLREYPGNFLQSFCLLSEIFDISDNNSSNVDAREILEFTKETFEKTVLEIKAGIEYRSLKSDVNPVVLSALIYLVLANNSSKDPILEKTLQVYGYTTKQIQLEILGFIRFLISNTRV